MKKTKEKLALAMIVCGNKDGKLLARCLESVKKYVDGIFITTTQSKTGGEVDVAKAFGAKLSHFDWVDDFSAARNYNFSQVPKEYKYILWLDDDDILRGGDKLRDTLSTMVQQKLDAVFMRYNYEIDKTTGEVLIVHPRERIIKRSSYEWKARLHETLVPRREIKAAQTDMVWVDHFPPETAKKENFARNVRILKKAYDAEGEKHDPRTEYYLARSYFDLGSDDETAYKKAEKLFQDYLQHSGWDEERAFAWNYLGEIYRIYKKYDEAIDCYFQAMKEKENFPSWFINLGVIYGLKGDWERAIFWTERGLSVKVPKTAMVLSPRDDKARALETLFLAFKSQNKLEQAEKVALKLLKMFPKEEVMIERVKFIKELRKKVRLAKGVYNLTQELVASNEKDKIETMLGALPISISDNAFIQNIKRTYLPPKKWKKKSIVWFCGKGFEPWSPDNLKTGLGGSETAVVQLSKHWAKLGYDVTVFGYPQKEKDHDGVHYKQYWRFNNLDEFDTLIIWRNPWILDQEYHAKRLFLDLHDVPSPAEFTEERVAKVDKIFVKSKYHRDFLPNVKDDKFVIISNGFDPALIGKEQKRQANKLIYASSYDRGLEWMLRYGWPAIKKDIKDAELHIYYGWNLFDVANKGNPERQIWKKKMLRLMSQDGVFEHGRVGHKELLLEKQKSQIHYYATTFEEIDCFPPGTYVMTSSGERPIDELTLNDKVLTHTGSFKNINVLMRKPFIGDMYTINVSCGEDIVCTPNHPIYVMRDKKLVWVKAKNIVRGDFIHAPKIGEDDGSVVFDLNEYIGTRINNFDTVKNSLPAKLVVDEDMAWWFGYFAGDGSASRNRGGASTGTVTVLVSDKQYSDIADRVRSGFNRLGLIAKEHKMRGCTAFKAYSYQLCRFLRDMFYAEDVNKVLPAVFMGATLNIKQAVVAGLLSADGCVYTKVVGGQQSIVFTSKSRRLVSQVRQLLIDTGQLGKIHTRTHKNGSRSYFFSFTKNPKYYFYKNMRGFILRKVTGVSKKGYAGNIYNMEVAGDNTYVACGSSVHNCISTRESAFAGCVPITTDYSALKEHAYCVRVPGDPYAKETQEAVARKIIELLKDNKKLEEQRKKSAKLVKEETWENVAKGWVSEL